MQADFTRQLAIIEKRGFSKIVASLNCMHYEWKNCLLFIKVTSVMEIVEAIANQSLHIMHVFFESHHSNNDVNVLDCSCLVHNMFTRVAHNMIFIVNG